MFHINKNLFFIPFSSVVLLISYLSISSFNLNSSYCFIGFIFDEVSLFLVYITCFVIFISFMFTISFLSAKVSLVLFFILLVCCLVFITDNIFLLYFFYECSLIPILYIIIKWGSYPERSMSSIILLLYTAVFTFPFLFFIFYFYLSHGSFTFSLFSNFLDSSLFISLIVFLAFAVKLPIYGLHFWLPIAHVEAPTFGSIILAGVLLKLGGVGLIRFSTLMDLNLLKAYLLGYFLVFLCYTTLVCCFQSDFKRLVAYSSVSHIMTIPIILLSCRFVGLKGLISVIFLHGLRSPLIFILVGIIYSYSSTRQHILVRGLVTYNPLLSFVMILSFFFTLSAPPFPSFIGEVFFSISTISVWVYSFWFILVFLFLSIVYNLLWLSSVNFLNQNISLNYSFIISYSLFLPLCLSLFLMPVSFSILFTFVM